MDGRTIIISDTVVLFVSLIDWRPIIVQILLIQHIFGIQPTIFLALKPANVISQAIFQKLS